MVKEQLGHLSSHFSFFEITMVPSLERALTARVAVQGWKKLQQGEKLEEIDGPIPDSLAGGYIIITVAPA